MDRKEAIKVVKSNFPDGRVQLSEALMILIPELESEDERIRKTLIRLFTEDSGEQYDCFTKEQILTWLEKQGEKNSLKIAKFKVGDILCRKGYIDHIVTEIYDKCEIPVYICKTDEGESHIGFDDQEKWNLKSNNWKPSVEQIIGISRTIE